MNVRTIVEQLNAHASGKTGRQALCVKSATGNSLGRLSEKQRQAVLGLTHLPLKVFFLCLYTQIVGLSALHRSRTHACH